MRTSVTEIHYERNVKWKQGLNAIGAVITFIVFIILTSTKFLEGAWVVALLIPILVFTFYGINKHYDRVAAALSTTGMTMGDFTEVADIVLVPVADVHRGTVLAIKYAKRISNHVRALTIITSPEMQERFMHRWHRFPEITADVELVTIDYDYRDILRPLVDYIIKVNHEEFSGLITTVVVPEFIPEHRAERVLHNQTANRLRSRLKQYKDIVIIDVPFLIDSQI